MCNIEVHAARVACEIRIYITQVFIRISPPPALLHRETVEHTVLSFVFHFRTCMYYGIVVFCAVDSITLTDSKYTGYAAFNMYEYKYSDKSRNTTCSFFKNYLKLQHVNLEQNSKQDWSAGINFFQITLFTFAVYQTNIFLTIKMYKLKLTNKTRQTFFG